MKQVNQPSLFESQECDDDATPLAERLRPRTLDEVAGQGHLIGEGKVLRGMIANDKVPSMIFWGPPGVGKTTLANVIALTTNARFVTFSAVTSGIKDIKDVMREAEEGRAFGRKTIVFVDEIHRFNKAQQDAFLPFVEKGSIILIGATTENPSFEVNGALLSRCKVFVLKGLAEEEIVGLLRRALADPRGFGRRRVVISDDMLKAIAVFANGDARAALSTLEMVVLNSEEAGGTIAKGKALISIEDGAVTVKDTHSNEESKIPADTVILAMGVRSVRPQYEEFRKAYGDDLILVGDSDRPGQIYDALHSGHDRAFVYKAR